MSWPSERIVSGLAYLLVAIGLWQNGRLAGRRGLGRNVWPWLGVAVGGIGIARAAGAPNGVSDVLRERARDAGWYPDRSTLQASATVGAVVVGISVVVFIAILTHRRGTGDTIPTLVWIGLGGLVVVAAARVVSLHHIDAVMERRLVGRRVVWIAEMAALATMIVGVGQGRTRLKADPQSLSAARRTPERWSWQVHSTFRQWQRCRRHR